MRRYYNVSNLRRADREQAGRRTQIHGVIMNSSFSLLLCGAAGSALMIGAAAAQPAGDANPLGGQVIVEQEDPTVNVTVPDPEVTVDQAAPEVTVEQPQPEITVTQPKPRVTVRQQAPIVTVEQAQPVVTVHIPEPIVTVRVPEPEVDVNTSEPQIEVQQPEPVVRFIRPQPRIIVEEVEPEIRIENAEPNVTVNEPEDVVVDVRQAEARVNIEQAGEPEVRVETAEPQVNVREAEGADVSVDQGEARVNIADYKTDGAGRMASEEDRTRYSETMRRHSMYRMKVSDLVGMEVISEDNQNVGDIDYLGMRGDTVVAIVGVGGFLGLGERDVAVPLDRLIVRDNRVILPRISEAELERMPEYDSREVRIVDTDDHIADLIDN